MEGALAEHYDYLVIGGGSAGCVLANRLSARSDLSVALIEAGVDTPPDHTDSVLWDSYPIIAYFDRRHQWTDLRVQTRPDGPLRTYEQARVMGGGSSINGQMANRGQPLDYDEWGEEGAAGWSWQTVAPYFRKLEHDLDFSDEHHGNDGPVRIRRVPKDAWPAFSAAATNAVIASGLPWIADQNTADFTPGCFPITINNAEEKRQSSATSYLSTDIRQRATLRILDQTRVIRLVMDGRRCTGVEVEDRSGRRTISAGEVVLCAGAIHSPAMLMRAGIGPRQALQTLGIEVQSDRAGVGQNLMDHPMISVSSFLKPQARLAKDQRRHIFLGMRWSSGMADCAPSDMYAVAYNRGAWHPIGWRIGGFLTWVNKSYSRGSVQLNSVDPLSEPDVQFNLLGDERDLGRMRDSVRYLVGLFNDPAVAAVAGKPFPTSYTERYKRLGAVSSKNTAITTLLGKVLDGPGGIRDRLLDQVISDGTRYESIMADDDAFGAYLRQTATGIWHASGTCRMGNPHDAMAVCDGEARVIGIDGLRVCDASIMPSAAEILVPACATPKVSYSLSSRRGNPEMPPN